MIEEFDCTQNYVLENDRALLRPLTGDDYELLLPFALNEPQLWKYSLVSAEGADGLRNYMNIALLGRDHKTEYPFIVFDKKFGEYAGSTRFYDINNDFSTVQLGYTWYGKKFQRTGLNRHCKFLLLTFAFERLGVERFELRADNKNERSIKAMKGIGCKVDGILRSNMPTREPSKRRDSIVFSILKDEWFGEVKKSLAKKIG